MHTLVTIFMHAPVTKIRRAARVRVLQAAGACYVTSALRSSTALLYLHFGVRGAASARGEAHRADVEIFPADFMHTLVTT